MIRVHVELAPCAAHKAQLSIDTGASDLHACMRFVRLMTEANALGYSLQDAVLHAILGKGQTMDRWHCRPAGEPTESVTSTSNVKTASVHCWAGCIL